MLSLCLVLVFGLVVELTKAGSVGLMRSPQALVNGIPIRVESTYYRAVVSARLLNVVLSLIRREEKKAGLRLRGREAMGGAERGGRKMQQWLFLARCW